MIDEPTLVERLRNPQWQPTQHLLDEAADRIDELGGKLTASEKGCAILAESLRESDKRIDELEKQQEEAMLYAMTEASKLREEITRLNAMLDKLEVDSRRCHCTCGLHR